MLSIRSASELTDFIFFTSFRVWLNPAVAKSSHTQSGLISPGCVSLACKRVVCSVSFRGSGSVAVT
jgi:hypothetical protein